MKSETAAKEKRDRNEEIAEKFNKMVDEGSFLKGTAAQQLSEEYALNAHTITQMAKLSRAKKAKEN